MHVCTHMCKLVCRNACRHVCRLCTDLSAPSHRSVGTLWLGMSVGIRIGIRTGVCAGMRAGVYMDMALCFTADRPLGSQTLDACRLCHRKQNLNQCHTCRPALRRAMPPAGRSPAAVDTCGALNLLHICSISALYVYTSAQYRRCRRRDLAAWV